ncbi:hypothetical protein A2867_03265 [Candidatus Daviesbacteria bacterium RIFCSPHIGHO2_01_FULL_40_11]|uniref:DUF4446 domain-containing protein n=1 Tax=Candidatus Daviesbacteria bacterium RIFCSPHIGHO2_01_FULL_40_11 TaxID=1797762 RepID=A0A1F5JL57_9BACT|nr:MAG: hypothetical protein A2867_03265 [Candidatus Daviesbacteria bacterium RIFCSPHIGHO2_01_FULL_40_11]OGE63040.1 MAG: hypothetical protein A2964_02385 [Candidatus Daviesbacteria bacterium RIFCSPLOWO2_01_FULL_40_27]
MYSDWVGPATLGILVVWLGVLSLFFLRQSKFLKSFFPRSGERDIRKKFEEILKTIESFRGELSDLESAVEAFRNQGLQHIQRVELLRFNPYDDTGGDISFTACFLDQKGSGIVITSLHARVGTRVFGKEVICGKSKKYQLSKEEEQVIKKAMEDE